MDRRIQKETAKLSDTSPRSESWLFAQAILGNAIASDVSLDAEARDRLTLEWAAQISTRAESKLHALQIQESRNHEVLSPSAQFAAELREGTWDPSKHPRRGGPPNAGWFAPTGTSGTTSQGTSASTSQGATSSPPPAKPSQRKPQSGDDGETPSKPEKLDLRDVRTYLNILYGDKGPKLLRAFEKSGGLLRIENPWLGKSALNTRDIWGPQHIRLRTDLNPIEAAKELMERLIDASGLTEVRQHLDHSGFANIDILRDSYR